MNILLVSLQRDLDTIGLKYLHYYLLKNEYNSYLLNLLNAELNDIDLEYIGEFVSRISPKFIGISLMSVEFFQARSLSVYLRSKFQSIPIIWGGIHPTISPESCLEYADYVCIGEGEKTILDFANALSRNESPADINNLCYLQDGKIVRNPLYPLIDNLDNLPAYEHIPANNFIKVREKILPVNKALFRKHARYSGKTYSIMSSRGCPLSCTYCCNNFLTQLYHQKKIRRRSIQNIVQELEKAVKDNLEIEYINFQDDCFLACSFKYLQEFCKEYKKKVGKPFIARSIPNYITPEKMDLLKNAGLAWISIGLQSGSNRVLKDIYKRRSLSEDFLKAARIINNFNIAAFYDVILDNPFENDEDKLETIKTLINTPKPFYTQIFSLSLYRGTELYEKALKECPDEMKDYHKKDYLSYQNDVLNKMVKLAALLDGKYMNKIVQLYKTDPDGIKFRVTLPVANLLAALVIEPITYFRVIRMSQRGSYKNTLKILPSYFQEGLMRYGKQLKSALHNA